MQEGYVVKGLDVHYKVGGKDYTASWDADANTFIIPAQHVTGDIELYVSYHSYNIAKTGSGAEDVTLPQQVLNYKADYTFTLAKKDGYAYTVKVAIGGQEITCTVNEAGTEYTIPGDKILGDTVVTVTRTKEASQITFTGSTDDLVGEVSRSAPVGQDFTFTITKDADYEYTVSAKYTESGETVPVTDNGNGTYTVKNVSGELVIKATEKAGKVTINLSGDAVDTITQKSWGTATEVDAGTALWFMAQPESGKELVVTVNGEVVAGMNMQAFMRYNITADKVTGTELNIVVNYKSSTDTITIIGSGDAWGDVDHDSSVGWEESGKVTDKTSAALKIKPAKDKTKDDYVVTINGKTQDLTQEGKGPRTRYMVAFVPADVAKDNIIKIDVSYKKAPEPTVTVDVREYLNLSGKTMFLITASCTDLAEGKVLAYNGNAMYWSEKYNAYAWLEIAADSLETVKAAATTDKFMVIDATDSNKISIAYNGDVNQTKSVDINDAQLVWNMYNAQYSDFNTVNIRKFLEADMNGDKTVSVLDATAIVDIITK